MDHQNICVFYAFLREDCVNSSMFTCSMVSLHSLTIASLTVTAQHRASESALIDARAELSALQAANASADHTVAQLTADLAEATQQCKAAQKALDDEMALRQARGQMRQS